MRMWAGFQVGTLCIISSLLVAHAQFGEWSTWSGCFHNGSCQNVIMTSHRSRLCKVPDENEHTDPTACKGERIEIRTCKHRENCTQQYVPNINQEHRATAKDKMASVVTNANNVSVHSKGTSDDLWIQTPLKETRQNTNDSRKPRAADLISLFGDQPEISRSSQSDTNAKDFLQLLNMADKTNIVGNEGEHLHDLNSLLGLVKKIPKDDPNEDNIVHYIKDVYNLLQSARSTLTMEEQTSVFITLPMEITTQSSTISPVETSTISSVEMSTITPVESVPTTVTFTEVPTTEPVIEVSFEPTPGMTTREQAIVTLEKTTPEEVRDLEEIWSTAVTVETMTSQRPVGESNTVLEMYVPTAHPTIREEGGEEFHPTKTISNPHPQTELSELELLDNTSKESAETHENVNPQELNDLGKLINAAEETMNNNQLSEHLEVLNDLGKLGEKPSRLPPSEVTLSPSAVIPEAHTRSTSEEEVPMEEINTYPSDIHPQVQATRPQKHDDFLQLLDDTMNDAAKVHHTANPQDLQDIKELIDAAQETMDNEQLSENLNRLSEILNPKEQPYAVEVTTIEAATTPTELSQFKELLELGKEEHSTSLAPTETIAAKPTLDGQYLLELLNKTERIHPADIQDEFKDDLDLLKHLFQTNTERPGEDIQEIVDNIGDLLSRTTTTPPPPPAAAAATTTTPPPLPTTTTKTTVYRYSTTQTHSTTAREAALLDLMEEFEESKEKHEEENHLQIENLEELFNGVEESNKDILNHEINHLNQLMNPTIIAMETQELTLKPTLGESTAAPSTVAAKEQMLQFVDEIAGFAKNDSVRSREEMENINDIFEGLQESGGDVLDDEVHQLLGLISPVETTSTTAQIISTAAYESTAKIEGEERLELIDDFEKTKKKTEKENHLHIQNLEELFGDVEESNKEILSHEINHLNQLLNPTTIPMETLEAMFETSLSVSTTAPSKLVPTKNELEFVDKILEIVFNDSLRSRAEVENIDDIFKEINESDRDVIRSQAIHQIFHLVMPVTPSIVTSPATNEEMYPLTTLKEPVVQPTISGQYLLDLFNRTEQISREGLVGELHKDLDLVDNFLEKVTQRSSEDLIDQIGNLLKVKSTVGTPTTFTPSIATSPATNEEMYPLTTLKEPVVQPTISGQYLLDLFNRTEQISREGLVGELHKDLDLVDNFLEKVTQRSSEDLIDQIGNLLKEKSTVGTPTTFTPSIATSPVTNEEMYPLTALKEPVVRPTISGQYLLDLFNRTEQISREALVGELHKDLDLVNNFLEKVTQRSSEDLIDQIGNLLKEKSTVGTPTTFTPSIATSPVTNEEMYPLTTLKEPVVRPTISGQYLLDLFNRTEQISREALVGELHKDLDPVNNFLEKVTQRSSEDLIDQIGNLLKVKSTVGTPTTFTPSIATSPAINEEMYPLTTLKEPVVQPTISGQYLLDLFNRTEQISREGLVGELHKDLDLVDNFLEKVTQRSSEYLIDQIENLLKEKSTVWTPTTFSTEPPGTFVGTEAITSKTTTETKEQHYLDLIENLGKTKLQSSEDNLKEIQALEAVFITSEKENENTLLDDLTRLQAVLSPEHVTTLPLTSEKFTSMTSISVAAEEGVLDLIDGISKLSENENIENIQGVHDIQDVLVAVQEPEEEDVLAEEVKHLADLFFHAGVSASKNTVVPTVVSENATGEISTSSTTTYTTSLTEPPLQPTIGGKYILDFLSKVEKADWVRWKDEFNNDEDIVNQFVETGTIRFRDDLQEAIGHIGILLSRKTTSEAPVVIGTKEESFTATQMPEQPYVASTQEAELLQILCLTPQPENGQLLGLIDTLGKTKVEADEENRLELQQLEEIMAKQEIQPEEILDVELSYLNHVLNPKEYTTAEASSLPPWKKASTPPSTPIAKGNLFNIFDEVAEVEKGERQENREGISFISDIFKGALNESDINFLNDEIYPLIDVLLPEEATSTATVSIPEEVTVEGTHVGIPKVTSVTPQSKKNQDALLDLLSGRSKFQNNLNEDTAEIQHIAELFANLRHSDKEILMNEIAQLGHDLYHGKETTPASSTKVSREQKVLTTPLLTEESQERTSHRFFPITKTEKILSTRAMTSGPTYSVTNETTKPTLPEESSTAPITFTPPANGEKFLDTLRYLVGRVNMDLPWDDMQRVGTLSKELDKDAKEKMKQEIGFMEDIIKKVGEMENRTAETTHVLPTTTMKMSTVALTKAPSPTTPYSPIDRWTEWSSWGTCSSTCGLGEQARRRECRLFIEGLVIPSTSCEGSRAETMVCETRRCPGKKQEMGFVEDIMKKVGEMENRTAETTHVLPTTTMKMSTVALTKAPSPTTPYSPVDRWTEWSSWGTCSSTCGLGEQARRRECRLFIEGLVIPSTSCEGSRAETMVCETRRCPGKKQEIGVVEYIMKKVGEMENRTAETTHVLPTTTMKTSPVALTTTLHLVKTTVGMQTTPEISTPSPTTPYSPVDQWTEWSSWGTCSSTCGLGEQARRRECRLFIKGLVIPSTSCEGSRAETMVCETRRCPEMPRVDGQWSVWSVWTDCSAMCGPGNHARYRLCDNPSSSGDGLPCEGAMTDSQDCFGSAKFCEEAGIEVPTQVTPEATAIRPTRQPVNKAITVAILATFIVVVVFVLVACVAVKVRRSYGMKQYRAAMPMFASDTLHSYLSRS